MAFCFSPFAVGWQVVTGCVFFLVTWVYLGRWHVIDDLRFFGFGCPRGMEHVTVVSLVGAW